MKSKCKFGKRNAVGALLLANFIIVSTAYGAPVRRPVPHEEAPSYDQAVCSKMSADYEEASKTLALNRALRTGEKSQVRASQLASEDNVTITQANMTLGLMRDNHCPMPSYAASSGRYVMQASACSVALAQQSADASFYRLQQTMGDAGQRPSTSLPQECDTAGWTYRQSTPAASQKPVAAVAAVASVSQTPRPSSPYKVGSTGFAQGPCPLCADPDGKRLQGAWDSKATTPEQKSKIEQVVSEHVVNGFIDWGATAKAYFDWRQDQPYGFR